MTDHHPPFRTSMDRARRALCALATVLILIGVAAADLSDSEAFTIEVRPSGIASIPIAIPTFTSDTSLSAEFRENMRALVLEDLSYAGIIKVLPREAYLAEPGRPDVNYEDWLFIGAEFMASVSLFSTGTHLRAEVALYDMAMKRKKSKQSFEIAFDRYVTLAHRLADHILYEVSGVQGFFEARIAFVSDRTSSANAVSKNIYAMDFDGSNLQPVTTNDSININPFWHSMNKVAFTSYIRQRPEILLRDLQSGRTALLAAFGGTNTGGIPSPDGKYIAVTASHNGISNIYLLHSDGRMYRQLTRHWSIDVSPAWSPDGNFIAFVSDRPGSPQVYKINLRTDEITRVTYEGRYNVSPVWSPDGNYIAYTSLEENKFNIYIVEKDGYNPQRLTYNSGHNETPRWSRDGNYLLFTSNRTGEFKLYVMDRTGTFQKRLKDGPGNNNMPDWVFPEKEK